MWKVSDIKEADKMFRVFHEYVHQNSWKINVLNNLNVTLELSSSKPIVILILSKMIPQLFLVLVTLTNPLLC